MQEMWVHLGWEEPGEKNMAIPAFLPEIPMNEPSKNLYEV